MSINNHEQFLIPGRYASLDLNDKLRFCVIVFIAKIESNNKEPLMRNVLFSAAHTLASWEILEIESSANRWSQQLFLFLRLPKLSSTSLSVDSLWTLRKSCTHKHTHLWKYYVYDSVATVASVVDFWICFLLSHAPCAVLIFSIAFPIGRAEPWIVRISSSFSF